MVALRSAYSKQTIAGKPEENRHYLFCSKYSDNAVRKLYLNRSYLKQNLLLQKVLTPSYNQHKNKASLFFKSVGQKSVKIISFTEHPRKVCESKIHCLH